MSGGQASTPPDLRRVLRRRDLIGLTVNSTIGAGILGLPGKLYALLGPYSLFACLAGGVLMGLVAACYAEAGTRLLGTGGSALYARAAFGAKLGFLTGWTNIATRLLAYASICNLAIAYLAGLMPAIDQPAWRIAAITSLTFGLGAVIYAGVVLSARANLVFTLIKLCLLAGFAVAGAVALLPWHIPNLPPAPPPGRFTSGIVLILFGLIGLDSTVVNAGEMRDPRRDLPISLAVGLAITVALYAAILLVCAGIVPDLAHSPRPIFDGAVAILGKPAGIVVVIGALASMTGTLFVILFVGPRMMLPFCEHGPLPNSLGAIHPRFRTPHRAVLLHTALAWILALSSNFLGALTASTLTRLFVYAMTAASLLRLRQKGFTERPAPLLLPAGSLVAAAACLLCIWLMTHSDPTAWLESSAILLLGLLVSAGRLRLRRQ